jgi:hypothetical protein
MHASVRHRRYSALAAVVVASVALAGCFGAGIRSVGSPLTSVQMPPGLWRSLGGSDCTWTRVRNGTPAVAGTNVRTNGPQYMQLEASDKGVAIGNCLPFWQQPGAFARPMVQPGNSFGDGDFLVGYELSPGTYAASAPRGQSCTWAVVKGFHGKDASGRNPDFVRGDTTTAGTPTAVIEAGNYGFTSRVCRSAASSRTSPTPT